MPYNISFQIDEISKSINEKLDKTIVDFLHNVGALGQKTARDTTLFHASPAFKKAITNSLTIHQASSGRYQQTVWSTKPWSHWLEYGNDPGGGWIYPRVKKVLRFYSRKAGGFVFAKRVRAHEPYPFMKNAMVVMFSQLEDLWEASKRKFF